MALEKIKERFPEKVYYWALLSVPGEKTVASDKKGDLYVIQRDIHPTLKLSVRPVV